MRGFVVAQSLTVDMPYHRRALAAARPVVAGFVVAGRESSAVRLRAGQRVVLIGRIATAVDDIPLLGKRGLFGQIVLTVQVIDVLGDDDALAILPRPPADAIALTEKGEVVNGRGDTPNKHDALTGTQPDGRAFPPGDDKTCHNWRSEEHTS